MAPPNRPSRERTEYSYEQELLPPGAGLSSADETELKVQQVQDQLLHLKRQQEEIERQKRELEELGRKQREFEHGRADMVDKLTRGLVILEREAFETKREMEQIHLIRENFSEQLTNIEAIHPEQWEGHHLLEELGKAIAYIDQARMVHQQARARLAALSSMETNPGGSQEHPVDILAEQTVSPSFGQLVRDGFAYSLSALLVQILLVVVYLVVTKR